MSSDTAAMIARRKKVLGSAHKLFYDEKDETILKLRPPMIFMQENADHFLHILDDVLGAA